MKKLVLVISSLLLVAACTSQNSNLPTYKPSEVAENEFIFKGDQSAVKAEMASMNVEITIDPIREKQNI